jgi:hypothetical protein
MRDRLIEILKRFCTDDCKITHQCGYCDFGDLTVCPSAVADHLLANGVIVPSVKVGQTVYSIVGGIIQVFEGAVYEITYGRFGFTYRSTRKGYFTLAFNDEHIGKNVFLTKEEAEKALERSGE